MDPNRIPEFKLSLSRLEAAACADYARGVLDLETAEQVRSSLERFLDRLGTAP
jgi:phosphoenolpyruvate-protein kinase (PTS system EI component)